MPRPPEYCGSAAVMPYSGEKYAMADGTASSAPVAEAASRWYQWSPSR